MNRIYSAVLLAGLLSPVVLVSRTTAQDPPPATQPQTTARQAPSPDEVVNTLASKLNLSEDQKAQIKPIIADRQQQIADLRADTSLRPRQKVQKIKGIFAESDKKINAVLNDQQKEQYAQMEQQMRDQMRARAQNRGSASAQQ